jgi:hypothetical protein
MIRVPTKSLGVVLGLAFLLGQLASAKSLTDVLAMDLVVHFVDVGVGDAVFSCEQGSR